MKDCLVCFSSKGREDYNKKLLRLLDSALTHWKGDYLVYSPDHELKEYKGIKIHRGYPTPGQIPSFTHEQMPYQFKMALIQQARELGYERIVWLDTSIELVKDITPLFGITGVTVFHNLGHNLSKYISDNALKLLGIGDFDNEMIDAIKQIWGGILFFDFTKENARLIFDEICRASLNGSFMDGGSTREGFVAHRHDQAVMSVITHNRCNLYPYGLVKCKPHYISGEYGNDCYLIYG